MNDFKITGGARIGLANASWPFATLSVSRNKLELNATILGKLVFLPTDIISVTPYSRLFSGGIKITHNVAKYSGEVIFWTSSPDELIRRIEGTGFLSNKATTAPYEQEEVRALQVSGGFPLKKPVTMALVVLWNVLFIAGLAAAYYVRDMAMFNVGALTGIGMLFIFSLLVLVMPAFATMVLKPGREVADVKKFLLFIMMISAVMFFSFYFNAAKLPFPFPDK